MNNFFNPFQRGVIVSLTGKFVNLIIPSSRLSQFFADTCTGIEIDNDWSTVRLEHDIVWIDVVMTKPQTVKVLNSTSNTVTDFRAKRPSLVLKQISEGRFIFGEAKRGYSTALGLTTEIVILGWGTVRKI